MLAPLSLILIGFAIGWIAHGISIEEDLAEELERFSANIEKLKREVFYCECGWWSLFEQTQCPHCHNKTLKQGWLISESE